MGRYKARELLHHGVDYVKCQISNREERLHKLLNLSSGSNFSYLDEHTIVEKIPDELSKMSKEFHRFYQIRDVKSNVTLAFMGIGGKKSGALTRSDFLEVTGQGLILRGGYRYYVDLMDRLHMDITKYIRVDVCMDIHVNTQYFLEHIVGDATKSKTRTPWYTKGIIHALYIGEKQLSKNTYQFVRIYNKKLDSNNRQKEWLYDEYDGIKDVTRLEVEIRRDKACFLTTEKLLSVDYLFGVCVRTFYPLNNQFFSFLHLEDFKRVEDAKGIWTRRLESKAKRREWMELYGTSFKDDRERSQWRSTFVSYAKKLFANGDSLENLYELLRENLSVEKNEFSTLALQSQNSETE